MYSEREDLVDIKEETELYTRFKGLLRDEKDNLSAVAEILASTPSLTSARLTKANSTDLKKRKNTILHLAVKFRRTDVIKHLCEKCKANVGYTNAAGWTPLFFACANKDLDTVRYLHEEAKADIRQPTMNGTPLLAAADSGSEEIIKYFLDQGVDVNEADLEGTSALYVAVFKGHVGLSEKLIEAGCDLRRRGTKESTVLHICAERGFMQIAQMLLS